MNPERIQKSQPKSKSSLGSSSTTEIQKKSRTNPEISTEV